MNSKISFLIGGDNLKRRIFTPQNIHLYCFGEDN